MEVIAKTGSEAYVKLIRQVLNEGEPTSPRGQLTYELLSTTTIIENLTDAHVLNTVRKVNLKILATETMHLLGGLSSLEQLDLASGGRFSQFADRGRLRGAYGPRIRRQLPRVVDLLQRDPDSRQAVLSIWTGQEHDETSRDVPCTLTLQFLLRDGQLHLRSSMRSNDVVLGIPYDWWMFSRLGLAVASALDVEPGSLTHTVGSTHLYDRDLGIANDVEDAGVLSKPRVAVPPALTYAGDFTDPVFRIKALRTAAKTVCLSNVIDVWEEDHPGVTWYHAHVPRLTRHEWCDSCGYVVRSADMVHGDICVECAG